MENFKVVMGCTTNGEETEFEGFKSYESAQEFVDNSKELDVSSGNESWFLYSIKTQQNPKKRTQTHQIMSQKKKNYNN